MKIITIMKKLRTTGFFHIFGASIFNYVISFLGSFVLVRILSKEAYGLYGYVWNVYSFFCVCSGFGMVSGVLQLCSESKSREKCGSIFLYGLKNGIRINIVLSMVIFLFSAVYVLPVSGANKLLALVSCFPIITIVFDVFVAFVRAQMHAKLFSYLSGLNVALNVFLSVLFAYHWSTVGFFIGKYIAGIALIVAVIYVYIKHFRYNIGALSSELKKKLWSLSFLSMLNNALGVLLPTVEILIIGYMLKDSESIAIYKVATLIPFALLTLSSAFTMYIYPYFAKNRLDYKWVRRYYKKSLIALGGIYFFICMFFMIFGKIIIVLCFGEGYIEAYSTYCILLIGTYFHGTFRALSGNIITSQQKLGFSLLSDVVAFLVCALSTFILVSEMKLLGAALAHVITILTSSIMLVLYAYFLIKDK